MSPQRTLIGHTASFNVTLAFIYDIIGCRHYLNLRLLIPVMEESWSSHELSVPHRKTVGCYHKAPVYSLHMLFNFD